MNTWDIGLGLWFCHFQPYLSYIVAVSFIGGGHRIIRQVTDKLYHIMLHEYISPWAVWDKHICKQQAEIPLFDAYIYLVTMVPL